MKTPKLVAATLSAAFLAACGGANPTSWMSLSGTSNAVLHSSREVKPRPNSAGPNLYVANVNTNAVNVYAAGTQKVLRTITYGVYGPVALAFDSLGNLYVLNG